MTHNIGSPLLKGTTPESYNNYDYSNYFRFQNKRSLEEIDTLLAYQEKLRSQLGAETADKIDKEADLYYNHEKFRIWQAKARFRAFFTTLVAVPAIFTLANGGHNGVGLMKRNRGLAMGAWVGTYMFTFYVWHRYVGYGSGPRTEQTYAKNVKMLRNLIITQ